VKRGAVGGLEQQCLHKLALCDFAAAEGPGSWVERPAENKVALLGFLKEEDSCVWGVSDLLKYLLNISEG